MMNDTEVLALLRASPHFAGLTGEDLETLHAALFVEDLPDGHVFTREGEVPESAYVLFEGTVRVTRASDVLPLQSVHRPGEVFGLAAVVEHGARTATCRAEGPVRVGTLYAAAFHMLAQASGPLALHFQHLVAAQLARDVRRLAQLLRDALATDASTRAAPLTASGR